MATICIAAHCYKLLKYENYFKQSFCLGENIFLKSFFPSYIYIRCVSKHTYLHTHHLNSISKVSLMLETRA